MSNPSSKGDMGEDNHSKPIRLQKYLADLGMTSRREADRWILAGRVDVNGKKASPGQTIIIGQDKISIDKKPLVAKEQAPKVYWLFYKPDYTLTSRVGSEQQATIFDLPSLQKIKFHISPVGRLDFRTTGLLILTNDGDLTHRLTHPSHHVQRSYHALVDEKLDDQQLQEIRRSIKLDDGPVTHVKIEFLRGQNLGASRGYWYDISVEEGRNRLVRRIFEHFGRTVTKLVRYRFHNLFLPPKLKPGEYVQLTQDQIRALKKAVRGPGRPKTTRG